MAARRESAGGFSSWWSLRRWAGSAPPHAIHRRLRVYPVQVQPKVSLFSANNQCGHPSRPEPQTQPRVLFLGAASSARAHAAMETKHKTPALVPFSSFFSSFFYDGPIYCHGGCSLSPAHYLPVWLRAANHTELFLFGCESQGTRCSENTPIYQDFGCSQDGTHTQFTEPPLILTARA